MLDIKWIRQNKEEFDNLLIRRGIQPMSDEISKLDENNRQLTTLVQQFQAARKKKSEEISQLKDKSSVKFEEIKRDVMHINEKLDDLTKNLSNNTKLQEILDSLPNLPMQDVPVGATEQSNKLIKSWGEIKHKAFSKEHFELGEKLGMMDFTQTAKISGSRFVTLSKDLARLERALSNFMLDIHTQEHGYIEVSPPYIVRSEAMYNVGQLPKFADESFLTTDGYRLIPTAEVSLTNMVCDTIIPRESLPIRYVAQTPCFRSEAGSSGRDTRGMIRMHQFNKVELVSITTPEDAEKEHKFMLEAAEKILQKLKIPYRIMLLCSGDMGFSAKKTYDIEVWLPGADNYREISSCSNCGDFQARRMNARYKEYGQDKTTFVHTLNGSALPIGRTIVAILENYQNEDGSVDIPEILISYMGGIKKINLPIK